MEKENWYNVVYELEKIKKGDQTGCQKVFKLTVGEVLPYIKSKVNDANTINEILNNTYNTAFANINSLEDSFDFLEYLQDIVEKETEKYIQNATTTKIEEKSKVKEKKPKKKGFFARNWYKFVIVLAVCAMVVTAGIYIYDNYIVDILEEKEEEDEDNSKDGEEGGEETTTEEVTTEETTTEEVTTEEATTEESTTEEETTVDENSYYDESDAEVVKDKISITPRYVYWDNGTLYAECYVVNGKSQTAYDINVNSLTISNSQGDIAAAYFGVLEDISLEPDGQIIWTFIFGENCVYMKDAELTDIECSANVSVSH